MHSIMTSLHALFSTLVLGIEEEKVLSTFLPSSVQSLFSIFLGHELGSRYLLRALLCIVVGTICKNLTLMENSTQTKFSFFVNEVIIMKVPGNYGLVIPGKKL